MTDLRRISALAIGLLVFLRVCIGWQFLYEGLWKWDTQDSPEPWTARGFLANAQGPMRGVFRSMTGDPDEVDWLGYDEIENDKGVVVERVPLVQYRWDNWLQRFADHYGLDDRQFNRVARVVQGPQVVTSDPFDMPDDVKLTGRLGNLVKYDPKSRQLTLQVSALDADNYWHPKYHLIPADREALLDLVPNVVEQPSEKGYSGVFESENAAHVEFAEAVHLLYERQRQLGYFEKLRALVLGNPENVTIVNEDEEFADSVDAERIGKIDQYRRRLERYDERLSDADIAFQRAHLQREWGELQRMKAELVGPIKQLEAEMQAEALAMISNDQRAKGPPPEPWTNQRIADSLAIWSLMILGALLMIGLATRFAAVLGAGMLLTFYMVWPPFPGVPEVPGTEHALFVNKNFIEAVALLAIAALPTGTWFGLDALFGRRREADVRTDPGGGAGKPVPETKPSPETKPVVPTYKTREPAPKT